MQKMRRALRPALVAAASLTVLGAVRDAGAQPACAAPKTTCAGANGYYASKEDLDRVTAVTDPLLRELKACLDAAGGKQMTPSFVMRWDSEGNPVAVKVDVPGYESLPCVAKIAGKLSQLQNPHETAIRCELGCPKPAPPPQQPPLVVQPPVPPPQQPPLVVQPPAQQPAPQAAQPAAIPVLTPARPEQSQPVRYEKVWYGWQGLISDGVAFTLTLGGGFAQTRSVLTMGIITFVLGTPIVHMAHAEIGRGFGSMGMRVLLPLVGAGIGAIAGLVSVSGSKDATSDAGDAAGTGAIVGSLVAGAGCAIIDAFALGYKSQKVEQEVTSRPRRGPSFTLSPSIDVRRDRAEIGVGGSF